MNVRLHQSHRQLRLLSKRLISTGTGPGQPRHVPQSNAAELQEKTPKLVENEALHRGNAEGRNIEPQEASSFHTSLLDLLSKRHPSTEKNLGQPQHLPQSYPHRPVEIQEKTPNHARNEALMTGNSEGRKLEPLTASTSYRSPLRILKAEALHLYMKSHSSMDQPMWGSWGIAMGSLSRSGSYNTIVLVLSGCYLKLR